MKHTDAHIISDQEYFFNENSAEKKVVPVHELFYNYVNKEQFRGFDWLGDCKKILEYGCGTGTSIDVFLKKRKQKDYAIYGVDIAGKTIEQAKKNYPRYTFYKISNNKIPQIKNNTMNGAYMLHVLHHARDHEEIFKEIHRTLKKGGKFLLNDLCSNNIFNTSARAMFGYLPSFMKKKFNDDLVVHDHIPEKYKVRVDVVVDQLQKAGFVIEHVGYGHLFFFLFGWVDRFVPLTKLTPVRSFYAHIMKFEDTLLVHPFFQKQAEVFYIACVKK